MSKYKINDLVLDIINDKHIILTENHPLFDPHTPYNDMLLYHNTLKFVDLKSGDQIYVYNNKPLLHAKAEFISLTDKLKYKVKLKDGRIRYFDHYFYKG